MPIGMSQYPQNSSGECTNQLTIIYTIFLIIYLQIIRHFALLHLTVAATPYFWIGRMEMLMLATLIADVAIVGRVSCSIDIAERGAALSAAPYGWFVVSIILAAHPTGKVAGSTDVSAEGNIVSCHFVIYIAIWALDSNQLRVEWL